MTWQNAIQLIVFPLLWLIVRDFLAFKREVYTKYMRKEDCIRNLGEKGGDIKDLFGDIDEFRGLLKEHIGWHKGRNQKNS